MSSSYGVTRFHKTTPSGFAVHPSVEGNLSCSRYVSVHLIVPLLSIPCPFLSQANRKGCGNTPQLRSSLLGGSWARLIDMKVRFVPSPWMATYLP